MALLLLGVGHLACSAQDHLASQGRRASPGSRSPLRGPADTRPSGAGWVLHPLEKPGSAASAVWGQGLHLEVDSGGLRWLTHGEAPAEASPFGAPEGLTGLIRDGDDWAAVGRSGTLYFFDEPLGPFVGVRSPPKPFVQTRSVHGSLIGIDAEGRMFRSTDVGRHFERIDSDGHFVDVGVNREGALYALAVPERWYSSNDRGAHFVAVELPSVAPIASFDSVDGDLVVPGLFGPVSPRAGGWEQAALPKPSKKSGALPSFPRMAPLIERHALLDDFGYSEVSAKQDDFVLLRGSLNAALTARPIERPADCDEFMVGGRSERPSLACVSTSSDVSRELRIYRLSSTGGSFEAIGTKLRGSLEKLKIVASPRDDLALWGVCAPHVSEKGCAPYGIVLVSAARDQLSFLQLPSGDNLLDLRFDGHDRLWALASRSKDNHLLLVGPLESSKTPRIVDLSLAVPQLVVSADARASFLFATSLFDKSGFLTVTVAGDGGPIVLTLDQQLNVVSAGRAPLGASAVHGTGRDLAAVDAAHHLYWGSTTGGLIWEREALPAKLCKADRCSIDLRCNSDGCMVGDELVRLGYGGQKASGVGAVRRVGEDDQPPAALSPLVCRAELGQAQALTGLWGVPDVHDVLLGEHLWVGVVGDEERATASAVFVKLGDLRVQRQILLGPVQSKQEYKIRFFPQVEGSAVLRYPVRAGSDELEGPIELAWDNRIEAVTANATVNAGTKGPGGAVILGEAVGPAMMSVAGSGVFVALGEPQRAEMYYFPGSSAASPSSSAAPERVQGLDWPKFAQYRMDEQLLAQLAQGARQEVVVAHGERASLLLLAHNRVVIRGSAQGKVEPHLMARLNQESGNVADVAIAYKGTRVGFLTFLSDLDGAPVRADFVELGADEAFLPAVSAALPKNLPPRPVTCNHEQRSSTPRVVRSGVFQRARAVKVHGVTPEPLTLRAEDMVLFGEGSRPCLGAYGARDSRDARDVRPRESYSAIIVPGLPGGSFLFHVAGSKADRRDASVQPMSCSFE